MDEKTVLVTGANGFLGREVVSRLQAANICVRATDLSTESAASNIMYCKADITKPEELKPVLENVTTVIHAAGLAHIFSLDVNSDGKFRHINEVGTANMASTAVAAGVKHFILISSVSVYGPYSGGLCDETMPCHPVGSYAISKYNAELIAMRIARKAGMPLTILRLATLYGDGDPGNVGRLISALSKGWFIWIGDGSNRKSLLYKEDAACACLKVIKLPASGINIYNISAPPCTMQDIVDAIAKRLGRNPLPVRIPGTLVLNIANLMSKLPGQRFSGLKLTIKNWLMEHLFSTARFNEAYGFQTKFSLEEGIKREVDWYKKTAKKKYGGPSHNSPK